MNFGMYVKAAKSFLKRNKETILFASGVAGTVTTGVTGVRAGMRIERKRRLAELEKGEELTKKDILKIAAPELVPVVLAAGTTVGCNTGMFISFNHRLEAAATTIGALSTQIDKIKNAEKEVVGEEKAEEIQKKAVESTTDNVPESPSGCIWFQEFWSNAEFYTTESELQRAIGEANLELTWCDMSLNDLFFLMKLKDHGNIYSEVNDDIGWTNGTKLKIRFTDGHLHNGTPCKVVIIDHKPEMLPKRMHR